jgi:hypothetical protein
MTQTSFICTCTLRSSMVVFRLKFVHECIDDFPKFTVVFVLKWEVGQIVEAIGKSLHLGITSPR